MLVTRDMISTKDACGAGLDLFDREFPAGEWTVTPASCLTLAHTFPWEWLAENVLSAKAKVRYLRVLAIQRDWYLTERQKLIDRARLENAGIADDGMKLQMTSIETTYSETRAAAFCAACAVEDTNAV